MVERVVSPDFWVSRILPEGILERWLVPDGSVVKAKAPVAELRIEGTLLNVVAPQDGTLVVTAQKNAIIEPGSVIGHIRPK